MLRAAGLSPCPPWEQEDPPPLVVHRAIAQWLQRAAESGRVQADNPHVAAQALLGALQFQSFLAFMIERQPLPTGDDPLLRQLVELIWRGLDPGRGARA